MITITEIVAITLDLRTVNFISEPFECVCIPPHDSPIWKLCIFFGQEG